MTTSRLSVQHFSDLIHWPSSHLLNSGTQYCEDHRRRRDEQNWAKWHNIREAPKTRQKSDGDHRSPWCKGPLVGKESQKDVRWLLFSWCKNHSIFYKSVSTCDGSGSSLLVSIYTSVSLDVENTTINFFKSNSLLILSQTLEHIRIPNCCFSLSLMAENWSRYLSITPKLMFTRSAVLLEMFVGKSVWHHG